MPVDTIISACLVLSVARFLIKVLTIVSSDINSFCSVASLAAAIIIAYVQYRQARQQQKSEEERNLKENRVRIENIESSIPSCVLRVAETLCLKFLFRNLQRIRTVK